MSEEQLLEKAQKYFFKIRLAGKNIEIECTSGRGFAACRNYLADFDVPDFTVKATRSRMLEEYTAFHGNSRCEELLDGKEEIGAMESSVICQEIAARMLDYNVLLMHGAVVAKDNKAYMFTAPSGVGKTTRASLWLKEYPDSIVVNGDKPFIMITDENVLACGTPWCGKEGWNTNTIVPLHAIFFLERAVESEDNLVKEISFCEALPMLLQQAYYPVGLDSVQRIIKLIEKLKEKVKFYRFRSTPTEDSVRLAYETACLR